MRQAWEDILGITVEVAPFTEADDPAHGRAHMLRTAHGALNIDPGAVMADLGQSSGIFMADLLNGSDPDLDALIVALNALSLDRQVERIAAAKSVEDLLLDRAYYIPIAWVAVYFGVKPWVQNVATNCDLSLYSIPEMTIAAH